VAERLPFLGLACLFLILFLHGLWHCGASPNPCDRAFALKLLSTSLSLSAAVVGAILPACWLLISLAIHGGTLESNLPPGYSMQLVLVALLVGSGFIVVTAFYSHVEHLKST
jgi:hypothetical protein